MTITTIDEILNVQVSTHMPLARHDDGENEKNIETEVSTHMPLARHDHIAQFVTTTKFSFYSHASCEA